MKANVKKLIMNLLFPPVCVFCGKRLSPKVKRRVCAKCANALQYCKAFNRCRRCGKPISVESAGLCKSCYTHRFYASGITSSFVYVDIARDGILRFKKEKNRGNAKTFAEYIAAMVKLDYKAIEFDAIVSVPPRKKASSDDGYDQAAQLAQAVALKLDLPYIKKAMYQIKKIKKQSFLKYADRIKNVRDNFAVRKDDLVKNKTILLIDDVCTTCATLEECAKALRNAGAYKVYAATLATVPALELT